LMPQSYPQLTSPERERLCFEDLKTAPLRSLMSLRRRRFDICVLELVGSRSFRNWKMAGLLLNARRVLIYTDEQSCFVLDRSHLKTFYRHLRRRYRSWPSSSVLFVPFGVLYLLARTAWLILRTNLHKRLDPRLRPMRPKGWEIRP